MDIAIAARLKRVRTILDASGMNVLLETHPPNIYYLTGFTGDSTILLVEPSSATLFTDGRFTIQAKDEARGIRAHIHRGSLVAAVGDYLRRKKRSRVALSPSRINLATWNALKKTAGKGVRWKPCDGLVDNLRAVKDASEVDRIRKAAVLGSEVMVEVIGLVKPGVTELELAAEIGYRMRLKGASAESFDAIVAAGPRSALPHAPQPNAESAKMELGFCPGPGCYTAPLLQRLNAHGARRPGVG